MTHSSGFMEKTNNTVDRFLVACFSLLLISFGCLGQDISLTINSGTEDIALQKKIERNVSNLLSTINDADSNRKTLGFSGINISEQARNSLTMLWENARFHCTDNELVERLLTTYDGSFQIRNIPLLISDGQGVPEEDCYQEADIDFDGEGKITSFYFGLKSNQYRNILYGGSTVEDLRMRQIILDYVEHFRTAYVQKDISFLEQVFSDDALIITGKVVRTKPTDLYPFISESIQYREYTKKQYLSRLRNVVFPNAKYIHVDFSDVKVTRHPTNEKFYGVRVRQAYDSGNYSDDGYLFMLWDFSDESFPQIHVRTWQPYWMDDEKTRPIPDDKLIGISSFKGI